MVKKIGIGLGIVFLLLLGVIIFFIFNTSSQYKKLSQGEMNEDFTCDTIPFTYATSGHILIPVKVNHSPGSYLFILDSGAKNILFRNFAKKQHFSSNGFGIAMGAHMNLFFSKIVSIPSIQIGDAVFKGVNAEEMDFPFDCMENVCGIIGTGIMSHLVWEIDFQKQIIIISKQFDGNKIDSSAIEIPLFENKYSHHLMAQIKFRTNKRPKSVLVDLGNNSTLNLEEDLLLQDSLNLRHKQILGEGSKGLGNKRNNTSYDSKYYLVDSLIFSQSGYVAHNIPVETSRKSLDLLGLGFFEKYKTIINWKDKKLILIPRDSVQNFIWNTYGFSTRYNKKSNNVEIESITNGSPASKAGLKLASQVVSINQKPFFDSLSYCDFRKVKQLTDTIRLGIRLNDSVQTYTLTKEPLFILNPGGHNH